MKILYIHQYFKTPAEAGGTRSYWFCLELLKKGHKVTVLTSRNVQQNFIERVNVNGIEVIYVRNAYSNTMGFAQRLWSFSRFMAVSVFLALKENNVDLVFATSTPLTVAVPALVKRFFTGAIYVFEVRDLWPEAPIQLGYIRNNLLIKFLRWFEKLVYSKAAHIIALSPGMYNGILKCGISPQKISLIPNFSKNDVFYKRETDVKLAAELNIDLADFNVVYTGAMGPANGLNYIIEAARLVKGSKVNFILLGSGREEEYLDNECKIHGLTNVKFLGEQPLNIVSEVLNFCNCAIVCFANYPILQTNSPNKFFDALAAGKPIIVNTPGWLKQIVEENNCGFYVDPADPSALATLLTQMAAGKFDLEKMGENSRLTAETQFDKQKLSSAFVAVLENTVKKA